MARRKKAAIAADKKRKALHPGKRVSAQGNTYHENRPNRSDIDRRKKFMAGGSADDSPKIYVADLAAYNEGKLIGEWLDLSNYDSGSEVMDAIQELLEKWSEEQGVEREEYAIHDAEFIPSNLYSEYMGEDTFDEIIEIRKVAEEVGVPTEVITQWMSDTGHNDPSSASDAYYGRYDDEEDFAYQLVDDIGIESFTDFERYLYVSDTDRRLLAQDESYYRTQDLSDEEMLEQTGNLSEYEDLESQIEDLESQIEDLESEQLDLDTDSDEGLERDNEIVNLISENEDKIKELEKEKDELLNRSKEDIENEIYDEWYNGLQDPYYFLVEEQGLYSSEDFKNASFVQIDYEALAEALGYDYNFVNYDGEVYVFSSNFKRGGNIKTAVNRKKARYKKAIKQYATGGNVGTIQKGDLIFAKNEGSRGLVGLVLTNPKKDSYGESVVSVYFRGYNGAILDASIDDISEINFSNMVYFAENNGDISAYKSIAAKKGYYINERYSDTNIYATGGNVGTIDADIAKLQAVVDSDMIPQAVKDKAKDKIAELQAKKSPAKKTKDAPKKPVVSKKATTKKAAPKKAAKKTPIAKKPKNSEKGRIMVLAKELHKEGKTTWAQSLKKAGAMIRESKGKPVVIKPTRIQKGTSDAKADKARVAAKPGKRISKSGRVYYENRKNRTDK